jgi:hypothetical protein
MREESTPRWKASSKAKMSFRRDDESLAGELHAGTREAGVGG